MRSGILLLVGMVWAIQSAAADSKPTVHIGMSTRMAVANPVFGWASKLSEELDADGFQTRIYPGSTLGSEGERDEQVILGLLQINESGGQDVMQYSQLLRALRLPFMFESSEQLGCLVRETDFLEQANQETSPRGIEVVDVVFFGSMSGLFSASGPVDSPSILAQHRIRALDRMQVLTVSAWGASAVQVSWEEITSALQTNIVDGYLNPISVPLQFRHTRQLPYFLQLNMAPGFRFVTASVKWRKGLSAEQNSQVDAALEAARQFNREDAAGRIRSDRSQLIKEGVQITVPSREFKQRIVEMSLPVYQQFVSEEAVAAVRNLVASRCSDVDVMGD